VIIVLMNTLSSQFFNLDGPFQTVLTP
jgi:hypothetical protein